MPAKLSCDRFQLLPILEQSLCIFCGLLFQSFQSFQPALCEKGGVASVHIGDQLTCAS